MRRITDETILNGIILGISITLILLTPQLIGRRLHGVRSVIILPQTIPILSLSMIALFSAWLLVHAYISKNKGMNGAIFVFDRSRIKIITTIFILFVGWLAIDVVGLLACTALVTGVLLVHFGVRDWKTILILSLTTSAFIYAFFEVGLKIPLPEGVVFISEG